jgi:hypothetical protein
VRFLGVVLIWIGLASAQEGYFPVREGLSWTYSNGETQTFAAPRVIAGVAAMVLLHSYEGNPISEDYLVYDVNGVTTLGTSAGGQILAYSPALRVYPAAPLEVGQSWKSTARVAGFDISLSAEVVAVRGVETPAGRYNAFQIRQQTITSTGGQTILDLFFVPSVGVVRWVMPDGTTIDLIEKNF